jgi:hypothetical protein
MFVTPFIGSVPQGKRGTLLTYALAYPVKEESSVIPFFNRDSHGCQ